MDDLFGEDRHSARGKVSMGLPPGVSGDAVFAGERQQFRPLLRRWKGDAFPDLFLLSIGMNPSTAESHIDDRTIRWEWDLTQRLGYSGYAKVNLADYRATYPDDLLEPGLTIRSEVNLPTIVEQAGRATLVLIACGAVNKVLRPLMVETVAALRAASVPLYCLGTTADGSPKHPVRLAKATPLQPF